VFISKLEKGSKLSDKNNPIESAFKNTKAFSTYTSGAVKKKLNRIPSLASCPRQPGCIGCLAEYLRDEQILRYSSDSARIQPAKATKLRVIKMRDHLDSSHALQLSTRSDHVDIVSLEISCTVTTAAE
jgi:hypothetical protein